MWLGTADSWPPWDVIYLAAVYNLLILSVKLFTSLMIPHISVISFSSMAFYYAHTGSNSSNVSHLRSYWTHLSSDVCVSYLTHCSISSPSHIFSHLLHLVTCYKHILLASCLTHFWTCSVHAWVMSEHDFTVSTHTGSLWYSSHLIVGSLLHALILGHSRLSPFLIKMAFSSFYFVLSTSPSLWSMLTMRSWVSTICRTHALSSLFKSSCKYRYDSSSSRLIVMVLSWSSVRSPVWSSYSSKLAVNSPPNGFPFSEKSRL